MGLFGWMKKRRAHKSSSREEGGETTVPFEDNAQYLGRWVRIEIPGNLFGTFLGYVYFDHDAGLSAKGGPENDPNLGTQPSHTLRLPLGPVEQLTDKEVLERRLPNPPEWITYFGEQPAADALWRTDPQLHGRFHPSFPDDIQVVAHDGEPRRTERQPELCWVRLVGAEPSPQRIVLYCEEATKLSEAEFSAQYCGKYIFVGRLLNQPHQLESVKQGEEVLIMTCTGTEHPVMSTRAYLTERESWQIIPCNICGFAECLDPPSVMARVRFPDTPPDAETASFTAFCPFCGGIQLLSRESAA